jgi:hypothetical protein
MPALGGRERFRPVCATRRPDRRAYDNFRRRARGVADGEGGLSGRRFPRGQALCMGRAMPPLPEVFGLLASSKLLEPDLTVRLLLPHVPHVVDGHAVALLVVGDVANDNVEGLARMREGGDLLRIKGVRLLRRLSNDLDRSVGVERIALRIEPLRLERSDGVSNSIRLMERLNDVQTDRRRLPLWCCPL